MDPDDEDEFKPIDPAVVAAIKAKWKAEERAAGVNVVSSDDENGEEDDVLISDTKDLARVMIGPGSDNNGINDTGIQKIQVLMHQQDRMYHIACSRCYL